MKPWRVKRLSTALKQSLDDLRKVERMKKTYKVDMGAWHEPNSHCSVCLAGARMVGLGAKPHEFIQPWNPDIDSATENMLCAMDSLRVGDVFEALVYVVGYDGACRIRELDTIEDRKMPAYSTIPARRAVWWKAMRQLQRDLKKAGL